MKRLIFFCFIICSISILSCKKNNPGSASFTSQFDFTTDVPAQADVPDTTIVISSDISINDPRLDNCDKASLKSFYIEIKEPSSQTFDFVKDVHLWLSAPGVPEIDVISATNINPSARRIDFTVNSSELVQYVKHKTMTVKLKVVLKKGFTQTTKVYGKIEFNVQGRLE